MGTKIYTRVFLTDYDDLKAPAGYTADFFRQIIFGDSPPSKTPDGKLLYSSLYTYFMSASDGELQFVGEVLGWKTAPSFFSGPKQPTYPPGVIGAISAAAHGYTGSQAKNLSTLSSGPHAGKKADVLIFIPVGMDHGGAARWWSHLKSDFSKWSQNNSGNGLSWHSAWETGGVTVEMSSLWWPDWKKVGEEAIDKMSVADRNKHLTLLPLSVLTHEVLHTIYRKNHGGMFPDMYGPEHDPWGIFDPMDGPAVATHYPLTMSGWSRGKFGWLVPERMPRRSHRGLVLMPLSSHNRTYSFPCSVLNPDESIVVENRENVKFPAGYHEKFEESPAYNGQGLLVYRDDPTGRRRVQSAKHGSIQRQTSVIHSGKHDDLLWPTASKMADLTGTALAPHGGAPLSGNHWPTLSSRTSTQELWWEFRNIKPVSPKEMVDGAIYGMSFDARFKALDLVNLYYRASWINDSGEPVGRWSNNVEQGGWHDQWTGADGLVMMQNNCPSAVVDGKKYHNVLLLHPSWKANGWVRGRYNLAQMARGNFRLWAVVALSDKAHGSDGMSFEFSHKEDKVKVKCEEPGERRVVCMDLISFAGTLDLKVEAGAKANRDWGYLLEAWMVPLPDVCKDLVTDADKATWTNGGGKALTFAGNTGSQGSADWCSNFVMNNGVTYGGTQLFTHPQWIDDGQVIGEFGPFLVPERAVLCAEVGLPETRRSYGDAFKFDVDFVIQNVTQAMWIKRAGGARDVGIGADGSVWVIGTSTSDGGHSVFKWNGLDWDKIDGGGERIAVDPQGRPWVVDDNQKIYRREGDQWIKKPGRAWDIGVGADGAVWVIGITNTNGGHCIFKWNGTDWDKIDGGGKRIAVDPIGRPWVVNDQGKIYRRVGNTWQNVTGAASDIGIGADGSVWIVDKPSTAGNDALVGKWDGSSGWTMSKHTAVGLSVDPDGLPWTVAKYAAIHHLLVECPLARDVPVRMYDPDDANYGKNPLKLNRPAVIEVYLNALKGYTGAFRIRVKTWGKASQDWVTWLNARIYTV